MPIIEPDPWAECDACPEKTPLVDNDLSEEDEDDDPKLPPAWVRIVCTRVISNPAYADEVAEHEHAVEQEISALVTTNAPSNVREALRARANASWRPTEPPLIVQTLTVIRCPRCAGDVQRKLDAPAWEDES